MIISSKLRRRRRLVLIGFLTIASMTSAAITASAQGYIQLNYDAYARTPGQNVFWGDRNLVMPWGIAFSSQGPIWIANAGSGTSTVYSGKNLGFRFPSFNQLVVTVPPGSASPAGTKGSPTGIVFNGTADFVVSQGAASGQALFIFATRDGTISGWSPEANASSTIITVDNSASGDMYTGLALGRNSAGTFLYATNFASGDIDVFDKNFAYASLAGSFIDPNLPAGFRPFNIQNIGDMLYVAYTSGYSDGLVDLFDAEGNFIQRFATGGTLNLPWGMALAPANFGQFSNDLLVGNLGDGHINAFDPNTGSFMGQLADPRGNPIVIKNLWGLAFGNGALAGRTNYLLFTAASNRGPFRIATPVWTVAGSSSLAFSDQGGDSTDAFLQVPQISGEK